MKFSKILIAVLGIAMSIAACSSGSDDGGGSGPKDKKSSFKIMAFNIRYNAPGDTGNTAWSARRGPCVQMIKSLKPDVICMQEPRYEQRTYLKEQLPEYEFLEDIRTGGYPGGASGSKGGNTVLLYRKGRFTQVDWGFYYLSETPDVQSTPWGASDQWHIAVWVHLKETTTDKEFWALSTHMPVTSGEAGQMARVKSSQLNVQKMLEKAGTDGVVFIGGDMNCATATADGTAALKAYFDWGKAGRSYAPAGDAYSFNNFSSAAGAATRNIDHIFFRGDILKVMPVTFHTVTENYGVPFISDHYPIMLTVLL